MTIEQSARREEGLAGALAQVLRRLPRAPLIPLGQAAAIGDLVATEAGELLVVNGDTENALVYVLRAGDLSGSLPVETPVRLLASQDQVYTFALAYLTLAGLIDDAGHVLGQEGADGKS